MSDQTTTSRATLGEALKSEGSVEMPSSEDLTRKVKARPLAANERITVDPATGDTFIVRVDKTFGEVTEDVKESAEQAASKAGSGLRKTGTAVKRGTLLTVVDAPRLGGKMAAAAIRNRKAKAAANSDRRIAERIIKTQTRKAGKAQAEATAEVLNAALQSDQS